MKWLSDHRAAALGFMVSAAVWPGMLQGSFVPRWAVIAVGAPMISTLDPRNLSAAMRGVILFLLALCALSIRVSPFPEAGIGDFIFIVILTLAFFAGAGLSSFDDLMHGIGAGLAISTAFCLMQFFHIWEPFVGSREPFGLFYNSEVMGEFTALVAAWSVVRRNWLLSVIAIAPVLMSHSRIGVAVVALSIIYAMKPGRWMLSLFVSGAIAGAIGMIVFLKLGDSLHRLTLWGATILAFTPFGNGLGWGTAAFPVEEFVHSDALQALAELGVGAMVLLAIPFAALRSNRGSDAERALFLAACFETLVSFPLHFPASGFLAASVAGFLAGGRLVVRDRASIGDTHHQRRRLWWANATRAYDGARESRGLGLSLRSIYSWIAPLRACQPGAYSGY